MQKWTITYFNETVKKEILSLPDTLVAKYIKLSNMMIDYGPKLGMPHTKMINKKVYELRLKGFEGIARVFYCAIVNREIVMLHSFIKKTDKIPIKELNIVNIRIKEVLNEKD